MGEKNQVLFTFLGVFNPQNDLVPGKEDISPQNHTYS